jgi:hypothetical protein
MIADHQITAISFERDSICLSIGGKTLVLPLEKVSKKLQEASDVQRKFFKVSPSGYGIHWPLIDEDLGIDALVKLHEQL